MKQIDYHKEGEEFEYNGRRFIPIDTCELCDMRDICDNPESMGCGCGHHHTDKRFVIYKEVNLRKELSNSFVILLSILLFSLFVAAVFILFLDKDFILSLLLAVACLFVVVDIIVDKKYNRP